MANLELANDEVLYVPILTDNEAGVAVPPPAGDTFSGSSDDATKFTVTIGVIPSGPNSGHPAAIFTPLVQVTSASVGYTISDSAGLVKFTGMADVVADTTPKSLTLDFANEVMVPQPIPAA